MKFALVNGERLEAEQGLTGICPSCEKPMISKCGVIKIKHWSHKGTRKCDPWWENETEWHRTWKNNFPLDYQEQVQFDESGEKHISDVKTVDGWVLEFQHSFISQNERNSRNQFYKKLVWIIDGTRRAKDKEQFFKLVNENITISMAPLIYKAFLDECALLKDWRDCHSFVFFDFGEEELWCLIPENEGTWGAITSIPRSLLIKMHLNNKDGTEEDYESFISRLITIVAEYNAKKPKPNPGYEYALFPPKYLAYRKRNKRKFRD